MRLKYLGLFLSKKLPLYSGLLLTSNLAVAQPIVMDMTQHYIDAEGGYDFLFNEQTGSYLEPVINKYNNQTPVSCGLIPCEARFKKGGINNQGTFWMQTSTSVNLSLRGNSSFSGNLLWHDKLSTPHQIVSFPGGGQHNSAYNKQGEIHDINDLGWVVGDSVTPFSVSNNPAARFPLKSAPPPSFDYGNEGMQTSFVWLDTDDNPQSENFRMLDTFWRYDQNWERIPDGSGSHVVQGPAGSRGAGRTWDLNSIETSSIDQVLYAQSTNACTGSGNCSFSNGFTNEFGDYHSPFIDLNGNTGYKWSVHSSEALNTTLAIRVSALSGNRSMSLRLNGNEVAVISASSTEAPRNTPSVNANGDVISRAHSGKEYGRWAVTFQAGTNEIELVDSEGTMEFDVYHLRIGNTLTSINTAPESHGVSINDDGYAVGYINYNTSLNPNSTSLDNVSDTWIWHRDFGMQNLFSFEGCDPFCHQTGFHPLNGYGINNNSPFDVLVYNDISKTTLIWNENGWNEIGNNFHAGHTPPQGADSFKPSGMNDKGVVIGNIKHGLNSYAYYWHQPLHTPFLTPYELTKITEISGCEPFCGSTYTQVTAINNVGAIGQIAGVSKVTSGTNQGEFHFFIWDFINGMTDLSSIHSMGSSSRVNDLNDAGQIVGYATTVSDNSNAEIFGFIAAANLGLIILPSDITSTEAINNDAQIVGTNGTLWSKNDSVYFDAKSTYWPNSIEVSDACGTSLLNNTGYEYLDTVEFYEPASLGFIEESLRGRFNTGDNNGFLTYEGKEDVYLTSEFWLSVTPGYPAQQWSERYKVWIDRDRDGEFEQDEVLTHIEGSNFGVGQQSMKFDVSSLSLDPFTYRMRIALGFGNINDFGCDGVNYGEIEDYNVRFQ